MGETVDTNTTITDASLLRGQVALITGASRGIGAATALLFARHGAAVGVNYYNNSGPVATSRTYPFRIMFITSNPRHGFARRFQRKRSPSLARVNRLIKRLTKPGMGFFSFETALQALQGYEIMNIIWKGQVQGVEKGEVRDQVTVLATLFGVVV